MLSAVLEWGGSSHPVILRNLSEGGALIEAKGVPPEGSPILFSRKDLRIDARVAWVEGRYAGIAFDSPLDRSELLRQVPKPREIFEPQFRRPGLASRPLSIADRQMVQVWATPTALRAN